jgi:hypothetical protein
MLLRQASKIGIDKVLDIPIDDETGDALEAHDWRCVRTVNGTLCSFYYCLYSLQQGRSSVWLSS